MLKRTDTWHRYTTILMTLPSVMYGSFKSWLNASDPETAILSGNRNRWKLLDNPDEIASWFAGYFEKFYNSTKKQKLWFQYLHSTKNTYFFMQENARLQTLSTVTEISSAIKELKRRKAHGLDCIQNETLFLRTPTLHMYLTPLQRNYQHRQNFIFLENRSYHSYLQR